LLTGLIIWIFGANVIWMLLDKTPPPWDMSAHMHIAFKYWNAMNTGDRWWENVLNVEPFYPPLFHLVLVPFIVLFDFSPDAAVIVNTLVLIAIVGFTYGIGSTLMGRRAGLIAAFFIPCYPVLVFASRQALIDPLLTAAVAAAYYFYFKSENLESTRWSLGFSLAFALGMIVKWTFLFFLLPVVLVGLFAGNESPRSRWPLQALFYAGMILATLGIPFLLYLLNDGRILALGIEMVLIGLLVGSVPRIGISPRKIFNLLMLTCVCLMICFPWYAHNLVSLTTGGMKSNLSGIREGDPVAGFARWWFYPQVMRLYTGVLLVIPFLAGLGLATFKGRVRNLLLVSWIVVPYLILTLIINKDTRYIMPVLPAMAVLSAAAIEWIRRAAIRRFAIRALVGVGVVTFLFTGFFPKTTATSSNPLVQGTGWVLGYWYPPFPDVWPIDRILDDILADARVKPGQWVTVRTLTNHRYFQRGLFRNSAEARNLPIEVKSVKRNLGEMTDYFITKNEGVGPAFIAANINSKKERLLYDPALQQTFSLFKSYPLPDDTVGLVLKRNVQPAKELEGIDNLGRVGLKFIEALRHYPIFGISDSQNLTVSIVPGENPEDLYSGRYRQIRISADWVVVNKVRVRGFEVVFENIQINPYDLFVNGKLILMALDRLVPRGTIWFEDLEELAFRAMKGKGTAQLTGRGDRLELTAHYLSGPVDVNARVVLGIQFAPGREILPVADTLEIGPFRIPRIFYRRWVDRPVALVPTSGWPLYTDIRELRILPRRLEINPP